LEVIFDKIFIIYFHLQVFIGKESFSYLFKKISKVIKKKILRVAWPKVSEFCSCFVFTPTHPHCPKSIFRGDLNGYFGDGGGGGEGWGVPF
jgi:hypothetical protein